MATATMETFGIDISSEPPVAFDDLTETQYRLLWADNCRLRHELAKTEFAAIEGRPAQIVPQFFGAGNGNGNTPAVTRSRAPSVHPQHADGGRMTLERTIENILSERPNLTSAEVCVAAKLPKSKLPTVRTKLSQSAKFRKNPDGTWKMA